MAEPTQTQTQAQDLMPPDIPSGHAIYDSIMSTIEPELTTVQLPLLKAKYAVETPEQKKERGKRYKKAFAAYREQYKIYAGGLAEKVRIYELHAMRSVEEESRKNEITAMGELEQALSQDAL